MSVLLDNLKQLIDSNSDRAGFIQNYLAKHGIQSTVIPVKDKKHIFVNFLGTSFNPQFKIKTLIAHYDIVPDSPGANDNSSAVIALLNFAVKVNERSKKGKVSNIRIIFTDGEELGECGVKDQGAYSLAEIFKRTGNIDTDVFVFDSIGRGTTPVLARAGLSAITATKANSSFVKNLAALFDRTQNILKKVSPQNWMTLPVPYSDNAGFLACGIPAVAITMLPKEEASLYYMELMKDKNLEKAVMNAKLDEDADFKFKYQEKMPKTWRLFHTPYDNFLSLSPDSFEIIEKVLDELLILYV